MAELVYEIVESIGKFSAEDSAWKKELNLVKWNNNAPKYDLRSWNADHTKMGKGITLTKEEIIALRDLLNSADL